MGLLITDLPEDVLIAIFSCLTVEDILSLTQTCRGLHTIGSADYVWHRSAIHFDLPLDLPAESGVVITESFSSNELRDAVVNALKLDRKWRDPNIYPRNASCIISRCDTFVDALQMLPGGKWLVTFQVERSSRTTIVSLWSLHDISHAAIAFQTQFRGCMEFHDTSHDRIHEEITIAVGLRIDGYESIRIYKVSTHAPEGPPLLALWRIVLETQPRELVDFGFLIGFQICGDIVTMVFNRYRDNGVEWEIQILFFNTCTRAGIVLTGLDYYQSNSTFMLFPEHFAFIGPAQHLYYDFPRSILGSSNIKDRLCDFREPRAICTLQHPGSRTNLLPSDEPTDSSLPQSSFQLAGFPLFRLDHASETEMPIDVMFRDTIYSGSAFSPTSDVSQVKVGSSGCRGVWRSKDFDGITLKKCTIARVMSGKVLPETTSTLMPAFSGLSFHPRDCRLLAFDEVSCRLCVCLSSGQVFALDY
ncbi:hypothetical protein DFH29DRAFT_120232 [Suillus ampliporus]|nr:hypothetical protein DFH29DRAFT_120232 [Suillus ampliporus]